MNHRIRSFFLSAVVSTTVSVTPLLLATSAAALTAAPNATSVTDSLSALEEKLFERTYKTDDVDTRLKRLEESILGEAQKGSPQDRLTYLQNAINSNEVTAGDKGGSSNHAAQSTSQTTAAAAPSATPATSYPAFDFGSYPRVTQLEQQILGTTYPKDALPDRLARLETKAFGKPSVSSDLSLRTDNLDQYAQRHDIYGERNIAGRPTAQAEPIASMESAPPPENPFENAGEITSADERVSTMEKTVFNHIFSSRDMQERVARLEKKLVPYEKNDAQKSLDSRITHLWTILSVANTMNKSPVLGSQNNLLASNPPSNVPRPAGNEADPSQQGGPQKQSWFRNMARSMGAYTERQPYGSDPLMTPNGAGGYGTPNGPGGWIP
jgi:TolA-binding protein